LGAETQVVDRTARALERVDLATVQVGGLVQVVRVVRAQLGLKVRAYKLKF
jgi:hypothetical protein